MEVRGQLFPPCEPTGLNSDHSADTRVTGVSEGEEIEKG